MNYRVSPQHVADRISLVRTKRHSRAVFNKSRRCVVGRDEPQGFSIPTEDVSKVGVTNPGGILQHGSEHWLKIAGRAADNLKHFGGSSLLLQCFRKVRGALPQFVEQPRILDSDDGLSGEVLKQFDLLLTKWSDFLPKDGNRADQVILFQ